MKKTTLSSSIAMVLGTASLGAQASLSTSAVLEFTTGGTGVVSCVLGTPPPCDNPLFNQTGLTGSYFNLSNTDTFMTANDGIHIGTVQQASGSHGGAPDGSENPTIDEPWGFNGNTGMHGTTSAITADDPNAPTTLDFTGWSVTWNGIADIPMGGDTTNFPTDTGLATITCSTASCSTSSTFVLDYSAHVPTGDPSNFGNALYTLHLEGHVGVQAVPVPAAVWLFGSGLLGLVGVARRKKASA